MKRTVVFLPGNSRSGNAHVACKVCCVGVLWFGLLSWTGMLIDEAPVFADEYAESVVRFSLENCAAARRFESRIKTFRVETPKLPDVAVAIGTREERDDYRVWVDQDNERAIVVHRRILAIEIQGKSKSDSSLNVEILENGIHRWRRTSLQVDPKETRVKSNYENFSRTFPPIVGMMYGQRGIPASQTPSGMQQDFLLKFKRDGVCRQLETGGIRMEWGSEKNPALQGKLLFSPGTGMPIEYTLVDDVEGEKTVVFHQSTRFNEHDGISLPVAASYERTSQRIYSGFSGPQIVESVGTFEIDWIAVNPESLAMPAIESLLNDWPDRLISLLDSKEVDTNLVR